MANKTPYEIRADLLNLAQRICYDKAVAMSAEAGCETVQLFPTTEEIVEEAEKLNTFVSHNSSN